MYKDSQSAHLIKKESGVSIVKKTTYCGFTNTKSTCKNIIVQVQTKFHECESKALEMGKFYYWTLMDCEKAIWNNAMSIAAESRSDTFFIIL